MDSKEWWEQGPPLPPKVAETTSYPYDSQNYAYAPQSPPSSPLNDQYTVQRKPVPQSNNPFVNRTHSYGPPAGGQPQHELLQPQPQQQRHATHFVPSLPQSAPPTYSEPHEHQPQPLSQQQMYFQPPPTRQTPVPVNQPTPPEYQQPQEQNHPDPRAQPQFPSQQTWSLTAQTPPPPHQSCTNSQSLVYNSAPTINPNGYRCHQPLPQSQPQPQYDRRATWSGSPLPPNAPPSGQYQLHHGHQNIPPQYYSQNPPPPPQGHPYLPSPQQRYYQGPPQPYQQYPQHKWGPPGPIPPQQHQQQQQRRSSTLGLPASASASVSGLTGKLTKFAKSSKAKKLMGLGGGLLIGSLIGDEIGEIGDGIGGIFEGSEEEVGGILGGGDGGGGEEYSAVPGGEGFIGAQQGPTAMDFAGQNYLHGSTFAGTSYLTA